MSIHTECISPGISLNARPSGLCILFGRMNHKVTNRDFKKYIPVYIKLKQVIQDSNRG